MKEMVAAEADCSQSLDELTKLKTEIDRLSSEQHDVEARIVVLQQSTQLRDTCTAMERLHREAREKRKDAESAAAGTEGWHAVAARRAPKNMSDP